MEILIVENEHKSALLLKELIELNPTCHVLNICDSIEATVNYLRLNQQNLDVIFMDIQLSDGQCFEIFDKIVVSLPVVYCASIHSSTLKSPKNHGIDYILKPFNKKDIEHAILKIELLKAHFNSD